MEMTSCISLRSSIEAFGRTSDLASTAMLRLHLESFRESQWSVNGVRDSRASICPTAYYGSPSERSINKERSSPTAGPSMVHLQIGLDRLKSLDLLTMHLSAHSHEVCIHQSWHAMHSQILKVMNRIWDIRHLANSCCENQSALK